MKKLILLFIFLLFLSGQETDLIPAPDFIVADVDGNMVILDSLLKKGPVIITFWALWCNMCIKELDALKTYSDEFDSLNITVLAISQDKTRSVPQVKPFALSHKWKYKVVLDQEKIMRDLFHVQAMPTLFIINQDKKIIFTHQGYRPGNEETIMEKVRELVNQTEENEPET